MSFFFFFTWQTGSAQFAEWASTKFLLCSSATHLTLRTGSKSHKVWHTRIQIFTLSIRKMNPMGQSAPPTENKNSCLPVPTYWGTIFKFLSQNRVVNLQSSACCRKHFAVKKKKENLFRGSFLESTHFSFLQLLKDEAANSSIVKILCRRVTSLFTCRQRHCDKWTPPVHSVSGSSSCWMHCSILFLSSRLMCFYLTFVSHYLSTTKTKRRLQPQWRSPSLVMLQNWYFKIQKDSFKNFFVTCS